MHQILKLIINYILNVISLTLLSSGTNRNCLISPSSDTFSISTAKLSRFFKKPYDKVWLGSSSGFNDAAATTDPDVLKLLLTCSSKHFSFYHL